MSLAEVVDDLLALDDLVAEEDDPDRKRSMEGVRLHLARRGRGAKVSEAAALLGLSQPTVRAWLAAGVLTPVADLRPARVDLSSLAAVKRTVDLVRMHGDDRHLLLGVLRHLRDGAAMAGAEAGLDDLRAGRLVDVADDLRREIDQTRASREPRPRSA